MFLLAIIYKYFKYQGWFVNVEFVGSTCIDMACAILVFPSGAEDGPCPCKTAKRLISKPAFAVLAFILHAQIK